MNPAFLQKQLKNNATDLQDFCQDLKVWGDEMKRKEESLKGNVVVAPKQRKTSHSKDAKNGTTKDIKTKTSVTDYSAWDKFDAEAECEKLEKDGEDESELSDEFDETSRDEALVQKEKGNKFVKTQNWKGAIECYTKAIDLYSYDPIFYANRALCYLKLKEFTKAESDCTLSLKLDQTYVKAYQRRAAAREALLQFENAKSDALKVLELEPNNKETKLMLDKLNKVTNTQANETRRVSKFTASRLKQNTSNNKLIDLQKPEAFPEIQFDDEKILVKPIKKPPHLRSKKPLKRIEIVESCGGKIEQSNKIEAVKNVVIEKKESSALPKANLDTNCLKSDDFKIVERKLEDAKDLKNNSNALVQKNDCPLEAPKNSVQFYKTWKQCGNSVERYHFLKIIDPQKIASIFQESMESDIFSGILDVLAKHFIADKLPVWDYLVNLTTIKRFSALTMFMTSGDKNCLWKLFDYARESNNNSQELIDNLIKSYEL